MLNNSNMGISIIIKIGCVLRYVKAPVKVLEKSMTGTFQYLKGQDSEANPMFNVFANF